MDWLVSRAGAELGDGLDASEIQPARLVAAHAGNQAEVIVLTATGFADVDPAADAAVIYWIWIGRHGRREHRLLELALHAPVVGGIVLQAELLLTAVSKDQREAFWLDA